MPTIYLSSSCLGVSWCSLVTHIKHSLFATESAARLGTWLLLHPFLRHQSLLALFPSRSLRGNFFPTESEPVGARSVPNSLNLYHLSRKCLFEVWKRAFFCMLHFHDLRKNPTKLWARRPCADHVIDVRVSWLIPRESSHHLWLDLWNPSEQKACTLRWFNMLLWKMDEHCIKLPYRSCSYYRKGP